MIKHEFMKAIDIAISRQRLELSRVTNDYMNQFVMTHSAQKHKTVIQQHLHCYDQFKRKMSALCDQAVVYDIPNLEMGKGVVAYEKNMEQYLDVGHTALPHDLMLIRTHVRNTLGISSGETPTEHKFITSEDSTTVFALVMTVAKLKELDGEFELPAEVKYVYMCFTSLGEIHSSNLCWNSVFVMKEVNHQITLSIIVPRYLAMFKENVLSRLCQQTDYTFRMGKSVEQHIFYLIETINMLRKCKNVTVEKVIPRSLTKKQRKQGRSEPALYHVIKVVLPNKRHGGNVTEGASQDTGLSVDLRVGHFKTFTSEKPLFGKHVGTYWWQPIAKNVRNAHYQVTLK